jgi:hypothetical protein
MVATARLRPSRTRRLKKSARIDVRRGGGTGRRIGLKIRRPHKGRVGSIPAPGTLNRGAPSDRAATAIEASIQERRQRGAFIVASENRRVSLTLTARMYESSFSQPGTAAGPETRGRSLSSTRRSVRHAATSFIRQSPVASRSRASRVAVPWSTVLGFVWIIQSVLPPGAMKMSKLRPTVNVSLPVQPASTV